jgi:predicted alpha/beta hydrolase
VCDDGYRLAATLVRSPSALGVIVVAPALATPSRFYLPFARFAASQGFDCWLFDYRGCGLSVDRSFKRALRLDDWGRRDLEAVAREALADRRGPNGERRRLYVVGHSIGGQLVGLSPSAVAAEGIVLVAASAPYWKRWPFPDRLKMFFASHLLMPCVAATRKSFPARWLGLSHSTLPSTIIGQWARWMRHPDYVFGFLTAEEVAAYSRVTCRVLSLGFSDDHLAPAANIEALLQRFSGADTRHTQIDPRSVGLPAIGHSGFFRRGLGQVLWPATLQGVAGGEFRSPANG